MSIKSIENEIIKIAKKIDMINIIGLTEEIDNEVPIYNANGITKEPNSKYPTINVVGVTEENEWDDTKTSYNILGLTETEKADKLALWYRSYGVDGVSMQPFINQVYDYPVADIGRNLPALVLIYNGFNQEHEAVRQTDTTYNFEFTLYLPAEGRTLENNWNDIKQLSTKVLNRYRQKATLNSQVWGSIITSGDTIIDAESRAQGRKTKWIGHTFNLEVTKTEA